MNPDFRTYPDQRIIGSRAFTSGVHETRGCFDPALFHAVLRGEIVAYVARDVFPAEACARVSDAFLATPGRYVYDVHPPIEAVGRPLFRAEPGWRDEYFDMAPIHRQQLAGVFARAGVPDAVEKIVSAVKAYFADLRVTARAIRHGARDGFYGIMRRWGAHSSDPAIPAAGLHEDRTQLRAHVGLETHRALHNVLASTCVYYGNGEHGGALRIFDLRPSVGDAALEELGSRGYGYPWSLAEGCRELVIQPRAGDVVTFFSDFLHSVDGISRGQRINSAFFASFDGLTRDTVFLWS
ncbi:2OG-Fe(II)-dependent halogenase WelO5 family protein [Sorangium sp. So ce341]|uniref:2OG-Fe(II)-dependent halogenase WelO5 family protein n=1 Tax=Sorangium sp. So ce341 TaxID=3133302 RepID=UPI003F62E7BE